MEPVATLADERGQVRRADGLAFAESGVSPVPGLSGLETPGRTPMGGRVVGGRVVIPGTDRTPSSVKARYRPPDSPGKKLVV